VKATPTSLSASRLGGNWARRVVSLELEAGHIATPCASPEAIGSVKATPTSLSASRLGGNWARRVVSLEPMMLCVRVRDTRHGSSLEAFRAMPHVVSYDIG